MTRDVQPPGAAPTPSVRELAWFVGRDVNATIGGGIAAMELLRRTFTKRGWMGPDDHALLVAVSRLTPGTNVLAYCVALGWRTHRAAGSAAALLAGSVPAAVVAFVVAAMLVRVDRYRSVQIVLALGMVVASFLVFSTAWHLLRPYLTIARRRMTLAVVGVSVALFMLSVSPVRVLFAAAVLGALWPTGRRERPQPPHAEAVRAAENTP